LVLICHIHSSHILPRLLIVAIHTSNIIKIAESTLN